MYDAGDMRCADLVLELRLLLQTMPPGAMLKLTATDPAAPVDLPAWCGITRHALVYMAHPDYWIRRRKG